MRPLSAFLLVLGLGVAAAEEQNPEAAIRAIVEGEAAFYQMGQEQGTRAAFLHFMTEDGIVFSPAPAKAHEVWSARPEGGLSLKWQPVFAAMSRSADLGYTTGPSEWRKDKSDETPFGYGQFISIWKKQADGAWKVQLDVGTENPKPTTQPDEPQLSFPSEGRVVASEKDLAAARRKLTQAQKKLAGTTRTDSTAGLLGSAADDLRVYREGVFAATGKDLARLMLSVRRGELTQTQMGGDISAAGDLAYSYGKYTLVRGETREHGHYLQIWRTATDGAWKLALDYQLPMPTERRKPAG